jgi:hypothetical protein
MSNLTLGTKTILKYTLLDWWYDKDEFNKSITVLNIDTDLNFIELCNFIETKYPNKEYYFDSPFRVIICGKLKKELI